MFRFLTLLLGFSFSLYSSPIPVSQLDEQVLDAFIPEIMQELEQDVVVQNDGRTRRGTREYGYSYFRLENKNYTLAPIPDFLQSLGEKVCEELGYAPHYFNNVILSFYEKGYFLEPHEDVNDSMPNLKGYFFDENVFGIVVEADETGHLYFVKDEVNRIPQLNLKPVYELEEKNGTVYCLCGPFRKFPFFHGVTKVSNRRISVTFRTVNFF